MHFFSRVLAVSTLALALSAPIARAAVVQDPAQPAALPDLGHSAPVSALTYAPDGKTVWSVDQTGELLVRSRDAKTTLLRGQILPDAQDLRVLRDGSFLVGQKLGAVALYAKIGSEIARSFAGPEVAAQTVKGQFPPLYNLVLCDWALSPDEQHLAIANIEVARKDEDKNRFSAGQSSVRVRVWNLQSGQIESEIAPIVKPEAKPRAPYIRFMPHLGWADDNHLVVATEVSTSTFDARTGEKSGQWNPSDAAAPVVDEAAEAEKSRQRIEKLPPAMQPRAREALERRLARGAKAPDAAPDFGALEGLSRDGRWLVSSTRAGLQLWDTRANTALALEDSGRSTVGGIAFSPDGSLVAERDRSALSVWKTGDGSERGTFYDRDIKLTDIAFAPDSSQIVVARDDGTALGWPLQMPLTKIAAVTFPGYFNGWRAIRSAGDTLLAATDREVATFDFNGKLKWMPSVANQSPVALAPKTTYSLDGISLAPDGKSWVESARIDSYTGTMEGQGIARSELRARAVGDGKILWRISDSSRARWINNTAWLPDGTLLATKEGVGLTVRPPDEPAPEMVTPTLYGGLNVLDGATGAPRDLGIDWSLKNHDYQSGGIEEMAVASGGETAVFADPNNTLLVDLTARKLVGLVKTNTVDWNGNIAISPDGQWMAGQYGSGGLGLWEIKRERKNDYGGADIKLDIGETERAGGVAYASDGKLALGLRDGRVMVWAPNPQKDAKPIWETVKGRAVTALSWSADGQTLTIGNARGDLQWRAGNSGQLQKTLRLTPPSQNSETPNWVQWNAAGAIGLSF